MTGKTLDDRIAETEKRIQQLEAQKKLLEQRAKDKERMDRTRRLIQIGGVMAHLGIDTLDKAQELQRRVERSDNVRLWLDSVIDGATIRSGHEPPDETSGPGGNE